MKTFQLNKKDIEYMTNVTTLMQQLNLQFNGLDTLLKVYVFNQLAPRFNIDQNKKDQEIKYDLIKGELYVVEPEGDKVAPSEVVEPKKK